MRRPARVLGLLLVLTAADANAEGEYGPMFGGSVVAAHGADQTETAGVELEMSVWYGRVGLAIAGSRQAALEEGGPRVTAVDASVRILAVRALVPSWLEPRDVELGIELQGLVERAWWDGLEREPSPVSYGLGLAVRLRGGSDDDSNLLAESRLFVRAMGARRDRSDVIARSSGEVAAGTDRELSVLVGLGAVFGGGQRGYIDRFRPRPLDTTLLLPAGPSR
jgi:hypothetical protein